MWLGGEEGQRAHFVLMARGLWPVARGVVGGVMWWCGTFACVKLSVLVAGLREERVG